MKYQFAKSASRARGACYNGFKFEVSGVWDFYIFGILCFYGVFYLFGLVNFWYSVEVTGFGDSLLRSLSFLVSDLLSILQKFEIFDIISLSMFVVSFIF